VPSDRELNQVASNFFRVFSRAEYALKASGFHKGDGNAEANWGAFASEVSGLIDSPSNESLATAIAFILSSPPKKQVIVSGVIDWSDASPTNTCSSQNLFVYIRRVRNNLFHGGKFNGHWFAPERSKQLISSSITILNDCIAHVGPVNLAYHG
jgi:hypothetical protein